MTNESVTDVVGQNVTDVPVRSVCANLQPCWIEGFPIRVSLARKRLIFSNLNDNNSIKVLTV